MRLRKLSFPILSLLAAAATSVAALVLTSSLALKSSRETFTNQLGTSIDQLGFNIELILQAHPDQVARRALLYPLLERYLLDDRFSCFKLTIPGKTIRIPPESLCQVKTDTEIIKIDLSDEASSTLHVYLDESEIDEATSAYLKMAAIVAAIVLGSFAASIAVFVLDRARTNRQLSERNLTTMFAASPVLMLELVQGGIIKQSSRGFQQLCDDLDVDIHQTISSVFESSSCDEIMTMMEECLRKPGEPQTAIQPLLIHTVHRTRGQLSGALAINPLGSANSFLLQLTDISAVIEDKERLESLLRYDSLTGALSRRALQEIYSNNSRRQSYGMLMVDVDYFKSINDAFGHIIGDEYLRHAVDLLNKTISRSSQVFRLSGEEFLILEENSGLEPTMAIAEEIRLKFANSPLISNGYSVLRTVSIGATVLGPSNLLEDILKVADRALLKSKTCGKDRVTFLSLSDYRAKELQRPSLEKVEEALANSQIDLHLEQIFNTKLQRVVGFETLLRWQLGGIPIPPMEFLETYYYATNRNGSGKDRIKILRQVLERLDLFSLDSRPWISYNIGLSDLEGSFLKLLEHIEPNFRALIILEVSEQLLGSRIDEGLVAGHLSRLSTLGYRIALDDFGVDGSNLSRLSLFPVDIVKLDKILIRGIDQSKTNQSIVSAVSMLSRNLSIEVIAEGVETYQESSILNQLGIHLHQGFFYGHSLPAEQAREAYLLAS